MPKAIPDLDIYETSIARNKELIAQCVSESKPLIDFCALITTNVAITTLLFVLLGRVLHGGSTLRLFFGVCRTVMLSWLVTSYANRAVDLAEETSLLKMRAFLRIPPDLQDRNFVFLAVWRAILTTIQLSAVWGVGFMCAKLLKVHVPL